jgi:multidrug efflux system outer membrane protein
VRAALVACVLAGCSTLAPNYQRPAAPIPQQLPGGAGQASAATVPWAELVKEPKLRTVIEQALSANRDLRAAALAIDAARAQYKVARAALLPNLDATVGVTNARTVIGPDNAAATSTFASAQLGIASWEIDLFGRIRSLSASAQHEMLAAVENAKAARISLIAEVCTAYIALAADHARLAIARDTQAIAKRTMEITEQLVGGGTSNRGDVFQATTVFQGARADVAALTAAIAQDRAALELLAGGPVADDLLPVALPGGLDWFAEVPVGLSSQVLLDRPDVRGAEHDLIAANANIGAARAALFPSLSLTAVGGLASIGLAALFTGPAAVWTIAPALVLPLFRPAARANVVLSRAQKQVLIARYEATIQSAFREVSDALAVRGTIAEQLAAQVALVEASQKSVDLAQARYQGGIDPFLATLISQRQLYAAKNSLVATQAAALTNRVTLYRVLGGGLR